MPPASPRCWKFCEVYGLSACQNVIFIYFFDSKISTTLLERVQSLLSIRARNARWMNCKLVLIQRSQFFHNRRFFSSHAKLRSTTQSFGMTLKVCNSLRFTVCDLHYDVLT